MSTDMSDLDREWTPKARPQSTMAKSLAAALDSAFMLDSQVDDLTTSISFKQSQVNMQNRELQELEARIRAAEGRLQQNGQIPTKRDTNNHQPSQDSANASSSSAPTTNSNNNRELEGRNNNNFNRQENPEGGQQGKGGWS